MDGGWLVDGEGRVMAMATWVGIRRVGRMDVGWLEADAGCDPRADTRAREQAGKAKQSSAELASEQRLVFCAGVAGSQSQTRVTRAVGGCM